MSAIAIERREGGMLRVEMNRPDTLNVLDEAMAAEITEAFAKAGGDQGVRCIVLAGRGRAFCAGADIQYMKRQGEAAEAANLEDARRFAGMLHTIATSPKPTIARVQGACIGGGVSLAVACDFTIAAESARFCVSEARFGLVPANMSPYLIAAVGLRRAQQLAISTLRIEAVHAHAIGLAWKAVPDAELDDAVDALARELRAAAPGAIAEIKTVYARVATMASPEVRELTATAFARARASEEGREGLAAFLEKRPPAWTRQG
jgi:methylglutaconyl-CoA hydratase